MRHTYFNIVSFFNCHVFANVVGITLSESFSQQFWSINANFYGISKPGSIKYF